MAEVARFREWDAAYPPGRRGGEWEIEYDHWPALYAGVLAFTDARPFIDWSAEELRAVLYVIARDNEDEHLVRSIRSSRPDTLLPLAEAAATMGERDAKWQLADQLGRLGQKGAREERVLLTFSRDESEYVRRRSLSALARLGSPAVEELSLQAWHRPDESQQWARMMALWCLHRTGSPHLERLLTEAEQGEHQLLADYALKLRLGEVEQ